MRYHYRVSLLLGAALSLSAGTISTGVNCSTSDPIFLYSSNAPLSDCLTYTLDRGVLQPNYARAEASPGHVLASHDVYRYAPGPRLTASALYGETYNVTFFGGSGLGVFTPCVQVSPQGGEASADLYLNSPAVQIPGSVNLFGVSHHIGSPYPNTSCPDVYNGFVFVFGQSSTFSVVLKASVDSQYSHQPYVRPTADFLSSFSVFGYARHEPLQGITWDLAPVPEPSTALLAALALGIIISVRGLAHVKTG